jgi:DNA processing protein
MRGDPAAAATGRALAVVGTRQPSRFGVTATDTLAGAAARDGAAIISGLALGVDSVSHRAALAQQAATVAVLGGGVDRPRDPKLAQAILDAGGLLMSEQPPGAPSSPQTLVARNRLQSGLAGAVLVAQTALTGGTPHTARFAAAQNRPVFCPSPPGDHPASAGLHVLLNAPAAELPAVMPAFASAKRLCQSLGQAPLARPVSRDNVRDLLDALG